MLHGFLHEVYSGSYLKYSKMSLRVEFGLLVCLLSTLFSKRCRTRNAELVFLGLGCSSVVRQLALIHEAQGSIPVL